jgi:hypothetical protein
MNILREFMDKCLSVSRLGKRWCDEAIQSIVEAGRTISYVETTTPSKADTLHIAVKRCDNRTFMHEYEQIVRFAIAKLNLKNVKLGFDTTEDVTWMSFSHNLRYSVYDTPLMSWQFLNVSIVEPFYLPLMSVPYRQIDDLDSLVIDLLNYIKTLPIIVDLILFDRGFYHAHLIDYLNGMNRGYSWPYLILVQEREPQRKYIQQTRDRDLIFAYYKHTFDYPKDKSTWKPSTEIMVKIVDEKFAWCYATNLSPSLKLCMEYPKRWNLETGFRVHDEARIKSKSRHLIVRYFYHLVGMLLIILWRLQGSICIIVFKRYLKWLEYQFYSDEIKSVVPPPPL